MPMSAASIQATTKFVYLINQKLVLGFKEPLYKQYVQKYPVRSDNAVLHFGP